MTKKDILREINSRIKRCKHIIKYTTKGNPGYEITISHWDGEIWGLRAMRNWIKNYK